MLNYNKIKCVDQINVKNKRVIVRVDFNVPINNGKILDTTRIDAALETITYLSDQGAKVILLSHLGRIKTVDDITSGKKSLRPVAKYLSKKITEYCKKTKTNTKYRVWFESNNTNNLLNEIINVMKFGDILLLENTRYNDVNKLNEVVKNESKCNLELSKIWAENCDIFINEAFATAHRKHASNYGVASLVKTVGIGFLMKNEIHNLTKLLTKINQPFVSIIGGAKIEDKINLIETLCEKSDMVLIGGGMALTFLKSLSFNIGASKFEPNMLPIALKIYKKYKDKIILPVDFKITKEFINKKGKNIHINEPFNNEMALDIGTETISIFKKILYNARTIFWNGPLGVFEFSNYADGTRSICDMIAERTSVGAYSLIGGGDSVSAIEHFNSKDNFSFISTGGGASLTFIEQKGMPGLDIILKKSL